MNTCTEQTSFFVIQKNIKVIKVSYKEKKLSENERI